MPSNDTNNNIYGFYIMSTNVSSTNVSEEAIAREVFSPNTVTVNNFSNKKQIIVNTTDDESCLTLDIYPHHIYVDTLAKCGITSGNQLLTMLDKLADRMSNIKYIELSDASEITICSTDINLYMLKLLTTGQSWYNSRGYFSNYDDPKSEKSRNKKIINMKYEEFVDLVYTQNLENFKRNNSIEEFAKKLEWRENRLKRKDLSEKAITNSKNKILEYQSIIDNYNTYFNEQIDKYIKEQKDDIKNGNELFPDTNKTVEQYFNYIWNDIRNKRCDEHTTKKCKWFSKFISTIDSSNIFQYDHILRKIVNQNGGGKRTGKKPIFSNRVKKTRRQRRN